MIIEERVQVQGILEETEDVFWIKINGGSGRAILYRSLHPDVVKGDWVVINKTATELQLGTGGWDIVRSVIDALPPSERMEEKSGHIMKARYLGDQHSVLSVESPESIEHHLFKGSFHLKGRYVFICELHSMIPILWFLLQIKRPKTHLSTIISDEASLPLAMSNHIRFLKMHSHFYSLTTGQAFGGDMETINVMTALQYVNEKFNNSAILVTLGPGVVGTNTHFGFSGLVQADWANGIGARGGIPIWIPRLSEVDPRSRHCGISHHTLTPLKEMTYATSILPLPTGPYSDPLLSKDKRELLNYPHVKVKGISEDRLLPLLTEVQKLSPFPLTTMGRTIDSDPLFFLGIAAACCLYLDETEHHSDNV